MLGNFISYLLLSAHAEHAVDVTPMYPRLFAAALSAFRMLVQMVVADVSASTNSPLIDVTFASPVNTFTRKEYHKKKLEDAVRMSEVQSNG